MTKIKDTPTALRPREKLLQKGADALSKSDLLAILLSSGIKGTNVTKLSQTIIKKFGQDFLNISIDDLLTISGIGKVKAMQIISAIALVKRFYQEQQGDEFIVKNAQDILMLTHELKDKKKEYLICLYLNAHHALIKKETISIGLLDKSLFHPREIFHPAIKLNASSIILIHNHPTGNPKPSQQDKKIVQKISEAGQIMGIPVVDFLITAKGGYYSFYQQLQNNDSTDYVEEGSQMGLFDVLEVKKPVYENNIKQCTISDKPNYIDLFCGAGGFSYGFDQAGFENIFSLDIEDSFCKTYKYNFPNHRLIQDDIKNITTEKINNITQGVSVDVIIGGPPCQGFSIAGNIGRKFINDPRNYLFKEFIRIVDIIKPKYFIMENVARLYTHNNGKTKDEIILSFKNIGYSIESEILNAADYGAPQIRKRVFFIGSKLNNNIIFPKKNTTNFKTIKEAINNLPNLKSGEKSEFANHIAMNHSQQMLEKMSYISDGGNREEIPKNIRPKSGDVRKYIKYNSNKPSVTVTGDMRKIFHYSQNRALTVRELARLQTFNDEFIFCGSSISQQQQIGNAVPPLMANIIAKLLKDMINNDKSSNIKFNNVFPKINFIGNKEKLAPWICDHFPVDVNSVFDAFSGGCSIGYESKKRGYKVISNDILKVNYLLSKSIIENNYEIITPKDISIIFSGTPFKGFMHKNYTNVFFFEEECMELDLYRKNIEKLSTDYKKSMALSLLRRAMIRKMPYSRFNISWDQIKQLRDEEYSYEKYKRKRAYHNESFKNHFLKNIGQYNNAVFCNKKDNQSLNKDIFYILKDIYADVIYLDPPYTGTMNDYFGFYGMLDEYIESNKIKGFENNFTDKKTTLLLFDKLFSNLKNYKYWFLSYNNNSYPSKDKLLYIISKYSKDIKLIKKSHIYKITGKIKKQKNEEYLFVIKNEKYREHLV